MVQVSIDQRCFESTPGPIDLQSLPCRVQYNGPLNMNYFVVNDDQARFRGRLLKKHTVEIPGYSFNVTEDMRLKYKVNQAQWWMHDDYPACKVEKWVQIAQVVNSLI